MGRRTQHAIGWGLIACAGLLAGSGARAADVAAGARSFRERCSLCHAVEQAGGGQGPSLAGVVGRQAGSAAFGYSKALREAGFTWDADHLDRYLADPQGAVPGSLMPVKVPDAAERRDLIAYLGTLTASAAPASSSASSPSPATPPLATGSAVRTGPAALGDWHVDAPGVRRHLTIADLPPPYATRSAGNPPRVVDRPAGRTPVAPPGFRVDLFSDAVENPRVLRVAPNGDIFVAETAAGRVAVLRAGDGARQAVRVGTFAAGLDAPFGIAFYPPGPAPRFVYVAETNRVLRFPYGSGDTTARGPAEVIVPQIVGSTGGHTTRDLAVSPDGTRLFVSVGSASNVPAGLPRKSAAEAAAWDAAHGLGAAWGAETDRADVLSFTPEGGDRQVYATGLRNCVGLAMQPGTGALWCATNERDGLGDDLVPDHVTHVRPGAWYGWPWFFIGDTEEPRLAGMRPDLKGRMTEPDVLLQSHSAPLGLAFMTGSAFPAADRGDVFVALHGSWNRTRRTGYKVVRVRVKDGVATGEYDDFLTGFVVNDGAVWGRPVGIAVAHDGALLVSEDGNDTIWRVSPDTGG